MSGDACEAEFYGAKWSITNPSIVNENGHSSPFVSRDPNSHILGAFEVTRHEWKTKYSYEYVPHPFSWMSVMKMHTRSSYFANAFLPHPPFTALCHGTQDLSRSSPSLLLSSFPSPELHR